MINVGHWALQRRLQALLSAPDVVLEEGGAGVAWMAGRVGGCDHLQFGDDNLGSKFDHV